MFGKKKINKEKEKDISQMRPESEYELAVNKFNLIENYRGLRSAQQIKDANWLDDYFLQRRKDEEFKKWFHANKPYIDELGEIMYKHFRAGAKMFEMLYVGDNETHVAYGEREFHRDFLVRLLKNYGYTVMDDLWNGRRVKLCIKYKD